MITGTACVLVTAALAGIKFLQISEAMALMESFPPPSESITVAQAEADTWEPTRLLSGTVRSPEHLVISAEMAGRVVELPYQSGEVVPKGAAVLVLFDDDLEAQREALEADLNLVSTQLERNRTLEADALSGFLYRLFARLEWVADRPVWESRKWLPSVLVIGWAATARSVA